MQYKNSVQDADMQVAHWLSFWRRDELLVFRIEPHLHHGVHIVLM